MQLPKDKSMEIKFTLPLPNLQIQTNDTLLLYRLYQGSATF